MQMPMAMSWQRVSVSSPTHNKLEQKSTYAFDSRCDLDVDLQSELDVDLQAASNLFCRPLAQAKRGFIQQSDIGNRALLSLPIGLSGLAWIWIR